MGVEMKIGVVVVVEAGSTGDSGAAMSGIRELGVGVGPLQVG